MLYCAVEPKWYVLTNNFVSRLSHDVVTCDVERSTSQVTLSWDKRKTELLLLFTTMNNHNLFYEILFLFAFVFIQSNMEIRYLKIFI